MPHPQPVPPASRLLLPPIGRRGFLAGALAAGVLAACGGDGGEESGATTTTPDGPVGTLSVARFYGPYFLAGAAARVPFGLADDEGLLPRELLPDSVGVTVRDPAGTVLAADVEATLFTAGLPRPYYTFAFTPDQPGFFDVSVDTGEGEPVPTQVQVVPEDEPIASAIVGPGDPLPELAIPTVADARGVDPICTRSPVCELHDRTTAEVLAAGESLALLVATPAFCQTVICGPVLDVLLAALPDHPGVTAVHAEVFREPESNAVPPVPDDFAPAVTELGLVFEPVLLTVGSDGIVRERLDYIFGDQEIRAALGRLAG